ncbi:hypothetical protein [Rhodococcus spongiicola]|uniref:Uncharacterized protein n=1 Tax=Rhodococcus spongiicola TaxID=2487352 RepID=A0A3S3A7Z3_9NOCA|nr:hypothetical protein [Rhodococcus spongiicola]RVW01686.1 hypothetical protein EF834_14895 [Rhodococcus spongiicola]
MSTAVALICLALLAGFVYRYVSPDRRSRLFRLEQFRPAAPLAGIFDEPDRAGTDGTSSSPARRGDQSSVAKLD